MSITYYDLFGPAQSYQRTADSPIEWGEHLSVHHPAIDAQHKAIFQLGTWIYDCWRQGAGVDVLRPALDQLAKLLETHFADEERLLAQIAYEGLELHAGKHRRMMSELKDIRERLQTPLDEDDGPRTPGLAAGWPVIKLILDFTIVHVMTDDLEYGKAMLASRAAA